MTDHRAEDAVEAAALVDSLREASLEDGASSWMYPEPRYSSRALLLDKAAYTISALLSRVEEVRKEERERCAKVANLFAEEAAADLADTPHRLRPTAHERLILRNHAAYEIAERIRSRPSQD